MRKYPRTDDDGIHFEAGLASLGTAFCGQLDDAAIVRGCDAAADLDRVIDRRPQRQRCTADSLGQGGAVEQLRRGVRHAFVHADVEDREDVWVGERSDCPGFAVEALQKLRICHCM